MPIFGNTNFGDANEYESNRGRLVGGQFVMGPEYGYGVSITMYGGCLTNPHRMKCALYDSNYNIVPNSETYEMIVEPLGWNQEITFLFRDPAPLLLPDAIYFIATWGELVSGTAGIRLYTSQNVQNQTEYRNYTYNAPDPPFPPEIRNLAIRYNHVPLIYCTYNLLPTCSNPIGMNGDIICGDPAYGQDPTHQYECQCVGGVCSWVDLGHSSICDLEEPCTNPQGTHGAIICGNPAYGQNPTHQYQCIDGVWTDLGYSGICDLEEPCTNPQGTHGAIICGDPAHGQDPTHQYQCIDGVWTDLGHSSICDLEEPCTNPQGTHGAIICGDPAHGQDPTHQYTCDDGQWIDDGWTSECDLAEPCTDPSGGHGSSKCIGLDRYICNDGTWELDMENAPECETPEIPVWVWPVLFGGAIVGVAIFYKFIKKKK